MKFNKSIGHDTDGIQTIQINPDEGRFAIIDRDGTPRYANVGYLKRSARDATSPGRRLPAMIESESVVQASVMRFEGRPDPEEVAVFGEGVSVKKFTLSEGIEVDLRRVELAPVGESETDFGYQALDTFHVPRLAGAAVMYEVTETPPPAVE